MFDWTWKVKFHFPPVLCSFQLKENTWLWFIWALSFLAKHKLAFLIEGMLTQIRTSFVQILQLLWWIFRETPLWFDWESPQLSMPKAWVLCHFCSHFTEWSYRLCWGSSSHRSQASYVFPPRSWHWTSKLWDVVLYPSHPSRLLWLPASSHIHLHLQAVADSTCPVWRDNFWSLMHHYCLRPRQCLGLCAWMTTMIVLCRATFKYIEKLWKLCRLKIPSTEQEHL